MNHRMDSSATALQRDSIALRDALRPGETKLHPHCDSTDTAVEEPLSQRDSSDTNEVITHFKVRAHCACSGGDCPGMTAAALKRGEHCSDCECKDLTRPFKAPGKSSGRKKSGNALYPGQLAEGSTLWKAERAKAKARSGGRCERKKDGGERCPRRASELHHIQSRKRLGSDYADNLLDLCLYCHRWVHANPKLATDQGLMRRAEVTA